MSLSFVKTAIANNLSINNIDEEVASLLETARNEIGLFEAMDEWLANNLVNLPKTVEGEVIVHFQDSRGFHQYVSKSLSDALWLSAMKQLQYHGAVSYGLLSTAFANWINDCVYTEHEDLGRKTYTRVTVTEEEMLPTAKLVLESMQEQNLISKNVCKKVVRLQTGNSITAKVCEITDELRVSLNTIIDELRVRCTMKCQPLQFVPRDWTNAYTGVGENAGLRLVKGNNYKVKRSKVAPKVLQAVNKLQRVKFIVAPVALETAKDMQIKRGLYESKDFAHMFSDKELNTEAYDVYSELEQLAGKEFYFPVSMDKRGRMYYRGGLLSPQGVDFCKAAFQFAEFKPLGKHGHKALAIHTANVLGQDKLSIKDRMKWVTSAWNDIMQVNTHMDIRTNKLFAGADTFQALVACKELQRLNAIEGEWSEKTSNLVCHQDGTCNGLQHTAAITGDRPTAEAVNCTAATYEDNPNDIYGLVASTAHDIAEQDGELVCAKLIAKYFRGMAKEPVMVTGYGALSSTVTSSVAKYLAQKGEDVTLARKISEFYLAAIQLQAGAVVELTHAITTRMKYAIADGNKKFTWVTADGFVASTMYELDEEFVVRVGKFYIKKRGMGKAPIDARKTAQAMSPNFVHSIDSTHLRMIINACDFDVVTVHDSIGSHPCDYFDTGRIIREKFALVHTCYDALEDLCNAMGQERPTFSEENDYKADEALQAAYIFS